MVIISLPHTSLIIVIFGSRFTSSSNVTIGILHFLVKTRVCNAKCLLIMLLFSQYPLIFHCSWQGPLYHSKSYALLLGSLAYTPSKSQELLPWHNLCNRSLRMSVLVNIALLCFQVPFNRVHPSSMKLPTNV